MTRPFFTFVETGVRGLAILALLQIGADLAPSIKETRWYRDVVGRTPFHHVVVYDTTVSAVGLNLIGELVKRRCHYVEVFGLLQFPHRADLRVPVNTELEDFKGVRGNRVPSPKAQSWGPWSLVYASTMPTPSSWEIWVSHLCPVVDQEGRGVLDPRTNRVAVALETNFFASGPWSTVSEEHAQ